MGNSLVSWYFPTHGVNRQLASGVTEYLTNKHKSEDDSLNEPKWPVTTNVCYSCLPTYLGTIVTVSEWLACWTQAQKGMGSYRSRDAVG